MNDAVILAARIGTLKKVVLWVDFIGSNTPDRHERAEAQEIGLMVRGRMKHLRQTRVQRETRLRRALANN